MGLIVCRPAIDEKTDWQEEATDAHNLQTLLGFEVALRDVLRDGPIAVVDVCELTDDRTDAEAEK